VVGGVVSVAAFGDWGDVVYVGGWASASFCPLADGVFAELVVA
jgi:hypothetical protein